MKKPNSRKESFLAKLPDYLIEDVENKFQENICFNFQFFDNSQSAGQDFREWEHAQLCKLTDTLKEYSKNTPLYWQSMRIGKGKSHVLEIYGRFPVNSDFIHPKHVPLDVEWARFRLEGSVRVIGFMVPRKACQKIAVRQTIFYVVFLDRDHRFYKTS